MSRLKRAARLLRIVLILIAISSSFMIKAEELDERLVAAQQNNQIKSACIEGKEYSFMLKDNNLYSLGRIQKGEGIRNVSSLPVLTHILDVAFCNLGDKASDELIVLTLSKETEQEEVYRKQHGQYGEDLMIYDLSAEKDEVKLTLKYTSPMKSVHPWKIEVGKLDDKAGEVNLFVGVCKDTRFYKEVINRPFFLSWNGEFLSRKWTGSYLSTDEYTDLIFLDFTGDGLDEIAALEKQKDGRYKVSLYKWLTFGFEYLISGEVKGTDAQSLILLPAQKEEERPSLYVESKWAWTKVKFTK